jgi:hypothetical protein
MIALRRGARDGRLPELGRLAFAAGPEQHGEVISDKFELIEEGLSRNSCGRVDQPKAGFAN